MSHNKSRLLNLKNVRLHGKILREMDHGNTPRSKRLAKAIAEEGPTEGVLALAAELYSEVNVPYTILGGHHEPIRVDEVEVVAALGANGFQVNREATVDQIRSQVVGQVIDEAEQRRLLNGRNYPALRRNGEIVGQAKDALKPNPAPDPRPHPELLPSRMTAVRKAREIDQGVLADRIAAAGYPIGRSGVSQWETGKNAVSGLRLTALAIALEVEEGVLNGELPLPTLQELPSFTRPPAPRIDAQALASEMKREVTERFAEAAQVEAGTPISRGLPTTAEDMIQMFTEAAAAMRQAQAAGAEVNALTEERDKLRRELAELWARHHGLLEAVRVVDQAMQKLTEHTLVGG